MSDKLRCQCGSVDFTDEDPSLPYETPQALHWVDKPCEAKPQPPTDKQTIARLQAELAEARAHWQQWQHAALSTGDLLAAAESREREMREALEAAVKSMEWMAERRMSADEPIVDVLVEIRQYAHSRALVAARALSGTDAPKETP